MLKPESLTFHLALFACGQAPVGLSSFPLALSSGSKSACVQIKWMLLFNYVTDTHQRWILFLFSLETQTRKCRCSINTNVNVKHWQVNSFCLFLDMQPFVVSVTFLLLARTFSKGPVHIVQHVFCIWSWSSKPRTALLKRGSSLSIWNRYNIITTT